MADEAEPLVADPPAADTPPPTAAPAAPVDTPPAAAVDTPPAEPKGYWADDWRERLASGVPQKDRDATLKRLARFQSPEGIFTSYRALEQRLATGDLKAPLKDGATDEEVAAWRKDNGIPEKPDDYLAALPDGLVVGEDDKPAVTAFVERMHGKNVPPAVVHDALAWWNDQKETQAAQMAERDAEMHAESEEKLRSEWGGEFKMNLNALKNYWAGQPMVDDKTSMLDVINSARLPDGRKLGNLPEVTKWLVGVVREINPAATVVPAGGDQVKNIDDELAEISAKRRANPSSVLRDEKLMARERQLLDAKAKLASRAA